MSLSDAVETYQDMSAIMDDNVWNTAWLPFMASGSGNFYVIDMLSGRVQEVMLAEDPDDEVSFSNLTAFLQNVCQNFTNGIYYIDEDGQLNKSCQRYNTRMEYTTQTRMDNEKDGKPQTNPVNDITQEWNILHRRGWTNEDGQVSEKDGKPQTNPVNEITQEINVLCGNYLGNVLAGLSKLGGEQGTAMSILGTLSSLSVAAYKNTGIPFLPFVCNNMPVVCAKMENAVKSMGKPRFLCRTTDKNQIRRNRRKACGKFRTKIGMSCDDYPFASTMQVGKGATVASVPIIENSIQGAQLCLLQAGTNGEWGVPPKSCYLLHGQSI
ncbi:hypothetical protein CHS0354_022289 [Potamilus streckersoni]|uniref:Deoxyribonuclease NucA/NucB domain-containing protein n=1 Tax=Potamilus streckersoni TaxID=2493646 RepID=A0AAE0TH05_9BIVA|nr:hypothetical protein CHS0354_022289 [Potamilus streckersoni]